MRLLARAESGDLTGLLDAAVLSLARELADVLARDYRDATITDVADALSLLSGVHWVRYQLLPEGEDQDDLRDCLRWSAVLLRVAPQLVPEPVRASLGAASGSANAIRELDDRGGSLYAAYQRTGDLQVLEAAITASREAVDATPAYDADRPNRLGNLGLALWTRFGRTGQLVDLEQASRRPSSSMTSARSPSASRRRGTRRRSQKISIG